MGLSISSIWERVWGMKDMRLLMVGLDAAGKVPSSDLQFIVDTLHALLLTSYLLIHRLRFYTNSN